MIYVNQLNKYFQDSHVLQDVSMTFDPHLTYAIIGSSGSGKSTFLRCLNGLETPTSGHVKIDDVDIFASKENLSKARSNMGMVFQNFNLFEHKSAIENVMFALIKVKKMSKEEAFNVASVALDKVGLSHRYNNYPHQLSGGEKQRVSIARTLAMSPQLVLFDEPTSALDPEMTIEVLKVIKALVKEGLKCILVTHEMSFAKEVADMIVYMDQGKILEVTPSETFFKQPTTPRAVQFLSHTQFKGETQ
jgi:arginine/lysine/histidine transport system ATP-binding protein